MDESRFSYLINYKFINSSGDKGCVFGVYDKMNKEFYYVDVFPDNAPRNTHNSFHCLYSEINITGRERKGLCNGKDYIDDIEYLVENKVDEVEAHSIMAAINNFIQNFQGVYDVVDFVKKFKESLFRDFICVNDGGCYPLITMTFIEGKFYYVVKKDNGGILFVKVENGQKIKESKIIKK